MKSAVVARPPSHAYPETPSCGLCDTEIAPGAWYVDLLLARNGAPRPAPTTFCRTCAREHIDLSSVSPLFGGAK